ncbi:hypothetical protein VB834_00680 [Limnoraphis robusta Tam1]|uniref:Glycosyltransferase family 1 protein n=1 Tax=Limnoraphis robusta CCNP1315 TaxID=3110306 RepID=A0ABU5TTD3_9CYAN|nr:hypothetical protein [Limnoraphis robusta]MEA5497218.1 hypothetical protein [Limnoraphis robusta BA-68 BA1]MEA5518167.1 hypothetical protein [Limnoraphis robusta CCNP1315]MEA5537538.1 hypothetical protein [Limnoraphis robusta Tam1]MEA5543389.1 hypothetical protein [Limnoraphis robusta CCNP1324]
MQKPSIYFYIPRDLFPKQFPQNINENWAGFCLGIYAWTLQTYLRLKADGFPCQLVDELPQSGIVIVHRNCLSIHKSLKPQNNLLFICIKAESNSYPYAQLHVVQNPQEASTINSRYYIPHWTQPGLIPRDHQRGETFKNIVFFGHIKNLTPELSSIEWQNKLEKLGLNWCPIINQNHWADYEKIDNRWNDYSQVDAVVAIRSFGKGNQYTNKPATKLFNAWLAGVPAILGYESAYQTEGKPNLNYLEVTSMNELISALKKLKSDSNFRQNIVEKGQLQAQKIHPERITKKWRYFLTEIAIPAFEDWCSKPRRVQNMILETRYLSWFIHRGQSKIASLALNIKR